MTHGSDMRDADGRAVDRPMQMQVEQVMDRRVTPAIGEVVGQAEVALQGATEEVRQQLQRLSQSVQAQPLAAIGLAALAGFVLARMTER